MTVNCFIVKIKSKHNHHTFVQSDCFESRAKAEWWGSAVCSAVSDLYWEIEER